MHNHGPCENVTSQWSGMKLWLLGNISSFVWANGVALDTTVYKRYQFIRPEASADAVDRVFTPSVSLSPPITTPDGGTTLGIGVTTPWDVRNVSLVTADYYTLQTIKRS